MTLRTALMALSLLAAAPAIAGTPAYITAALANRTDAQKAQDAERKPEEILTAVGIKPGWVVADLIPGRDQYFDKLFISIVGDKGAVDLYLPEEMVAHAKGPLPENGSHPDPTHPNVAFLRTKVNDFALPAPADMIWIRQNYHDLYDPFMGPADVPAFNKKVMAALKPGGLYVIIDHAAPDGSDLADTNTTHRIDEARVKKDLKAAGFVLVKEVNVLRNPADPRTALVFDKSIRGHTDQFVLIYRKPK